MAKKKTSVKTSQATLIRFLEAVTQDDLKTIKKLHKQGLDLNLTNDEGSNAAHIALMFKASKETIQYLWENNVDFNKSNNLGQTPAFCAVANGRLDILTMLLENGTDVNTIAASGENMAHIAAIYNQPDALPILKEHGIDINKKDDDGNTPLHYGVMLDDVALIDALALAGADPTIPNNAKEKPINVATNTKIKKHLKEITKTFLKEKAQKEAQKSKKEQTVSQEKVNTTVSTKKSPAQTGAKKTAQEKKAETPVKPTPETAQTKPAETAEKPTANKADDKIEKLSTWERLEAFSHAILAEKYEEADKYLNDIVKKGLHSFTLKQNYNNKMTLAQMAVFYNNPKLLKYLLSRDLVHFKYKNKDGLTVLKMAQELKNKEAEDLLINAQKGEKIDFNPNEKLPDLPKLSHWDNELIGYVLRNQYEEAHFALERGANPEKILSLTHSTLAHFAAFNDNYNALLFLRDIGVDINKKDIHGLTPKDYARIFNCQTALRILEQIEEVEKTQQSEEKTKKTAKAEKEISYKNFYNAVLDCDWAEADRQLKANKSFLNTRESGRWMSVGHVAVYEGKTASLKYLVSRGLDLNIKTPMGITIKDMAEGLKAQNIIDILEQGKKVNFDPKEKNPSLQPTNKEDLDLFAAVANGNENVVSSALRKGGNVNMTLGPASYTLGHLAAATGNWKVFGLLHEAGMDLFAKDANGLTAKDHASIVGLSAVTHNIEELEKGIKNKSNPYVLANTEDYDVYESLSHHIQSCNWKAAAKDIKNGAKLNAQNELYSQRTLLHKYALTGQTTRVHFLLSQGADFLVKDQNSLTVEDYARALKDKKMLHILNSYKNGTPIAFNPKEKEANLIPPKCNQATATFIYSVLAEDSLLVALPENGKNLNVQVGALKQSMAHISVFNPFILETLAKIGVDFSLKDANGLTVKDYATSLNLPESLKVIEAVENGEPFKALVDVAAKKTTKISEIGLLRKEISEETEKRKTATARLKAVINEAIKGDTPTEKNAQNVTDEENIATVGNTTTKEYAPTHKIVENTLDTDTVLATALDGKPTADDVLTDIFDKSAAKEAQHNESIAAAFDVSATTDANSKDIDDLIANAIDNAATKTKSAAKPTVKPTTEKEVAEKPIIVNGNKLYFSKMTQKDKNELLIQCAVLNDTALINKCLVNGADITTTQNEGLNLAHIAAITNNMSIIELLAGNKMLQYLLWETDNLGNKPIDYANHWAHLDIISKITQVQKETESAKATSRSTIPEKETLRNVVEEKRTETGADKKPKSASPTPQATTQSVKSAPKHSDALEEKSSPNARPAALWAALYFNDIEALKRYHQEGGSFNIMDTNGNTPLHFVASKGYLKQLQYILENEKNVDIDAANKKGETPLILAAKAGHLAVSHQLLEAKANPNKTLLNGISSVHIAVIANDIDLLKDLHQHGANLNAKDDLGATAALYAAMGGHINPLIYLHENGININEGNEILQTTPYEAAKKRGYLEAAEVIKQRTMNPLKNLIHKIENDIQNSQLDQAAEKILQNVKKQKNSFQNDESEAADKGLSALADLLGILFANDANQEFPRNPVNTVQNNPATPAQPTQEQPEKINSAEDLNQVLLNAVMDSDLRAVQVLVEDFGLDVNKTISEDKATVLHYAVAMRDVEMLEYLLEHNANPNAKDSNDMTPLHHAITNNYPEMVPVLLSFGAKTDIPCQGHSVTKLAEQIGNPIIINQLKMNNSHKMPQTNPQEILNHKLWKAIEEGDYSSIVHLTKVNADLHQVDRDGDGLAHLAATNPKDNVGIIKWLDDHGVDLSLKDNTGDTPAHLAAAAGNICILKYLIDEGYDFTSQNTTNGYTPKDVALLYGQTEAAILLDEAAKDSFALEGLIEKNLLTTIKYHKHAFVNQDGTLNTNMAKKIKKMPTLNVFFAVQNSGCLKDKRVKEMLKGAFPAPMLNFIFKNSKIKRNLD